MAAEPPLTPELLATFGPLRAYPAGRRVDISVDPDRLVSMFLSGNQTRRIGPLVDQYPAPLLELHPHLAKQHGRADGDWVTVEPRRRDPASACGGLPPNLFAVVMATGIVSLAVHGAGRPVVAHALFWLNVGLHAVLSALLLARVLLHRADLVADLSRHAKAPGFFTSACWPAC